MIKSTLPAFAVFIACYLLLGGCGSGSGEENAARDGGADWETVLKDWKSADGPTRLAIFQAHGKLPQLKSLENNFLGKSAQDLKGVFGEPDKVEGRRLLANGKASYFYFLGTTTKQTPYKEQDYIVWEIDKEDKVGDFSIKQSSSSN